MKYEMMHPREQVARFMARIYEFGMTTTSGGNISVRDAEGNMWISPAGVDKGSLRSEDIVRVREDGECDGQHPPSSEYPFHLAIYRDRPELKAVVHAHPSALVAFSIVREIPDTGVIPQARSICGAVGHAPYALPGSQALGREIAQAFAAGYNTVLLENHGVVCGGETLFQAFQRFETLDFCARLLVKARTLGPVHTLTDEQLALLHHNKNFLPEFEPETRTNREKELRKIICDLVRRAYQQHMMTSTEGTLSARLGSDAFLITPYGVDRQDIEVEDVVLVRDGRREAGKVPSRSVILHKTIYERHPWISSVITAQAPNVMAFAVTDEAFDTRTIPESYIVLRDVPRLEFGPQFTEEWRVVEAIGPRTPVLLLVNDAVLAVGPSPIKAFDCLEVAEFTARSLINARPLGALAGMKESQITELEQVFLGLPRTDG
jgi:L-fuculose-phosphate aldolase